MTRSDAERIYDKLPSSDKRLMGIIGVLFAFEFSLTMLNRIRIMLQQREGVFGADK